MWFATPNCLKTVHMCVKLDKYCFNSLCINNPNQFCIQFNILIPKSSFPVKTTFSSWLFYWNKIIIKYLGSQKENHKMQKNWNPLRNKLTSSISVLFSCLFACMWPALQNLSSQNQTSINEIKHLKPKSIGINLEYF